MKNKGQLNVRKEPSISPVCIVIPTYNESKNIESLLDEIFINESKNQDRKIKINALVVDDNSPDGTAGIVNKYRKESPHGKKVHLLLRKNKEGLGAAYIAGMKHAINKVNPKVIMEMDADHSHKPQDIFRLLEGIQNGADFVIGSRYVKGGKIPKNWGLHRKFISFCASNITRFGLGLGKVKDCSGGYRAIRTEVIKKINLDSLNVKGYAFQAVLLEAALYHKFKVAEVPITFNERSKGTSKMRFSDMTEGWKIIFAIRTKRILSRIKSIFHIKGAK